MAVRSRSMGFLTSVAAGSTTVLCSIPAGRTGIVRSWHVINRAGSAQTVEVGVRRGGSTVRLTALVALATGETLRNPHDDLVLNPGDELVVIAAAGNTSAALQALASGSLLMGSPE